MRLKKCDTVLFLDMPRIVCLWRVIKRTLIYRGTNRPDMSKGCNKRFDFKFLHWIWGYPKKDKLVVEDLVKIIHLASKREVENFYTKVAN